jgi:hypothetical protein
MGGYDLVEGEGAGLARPAEFRDLLQQAGETLGRKLSPRTRQEYAKAFRHFEAWANGMGLPALPTTPVVALVYVQSMRPDLEKGQISFSTVTMRLAALADAQATAGGLPVTSDPKVKELLRVLRREVGTKQVQKAPLTLKMLERLQPLWEGNTLTRRQLQARAIILLGFALAARRSELVGLDLSDLRLEDEGMVVLIRRSKTDQEGKGAELGVPRVAGPLCPVAAVEAWVRQLPLDVDGPLFRTVDPADVATTQRLSERAVARIVQRAAKVCGVDAERFGAHSLRAGYVTEAARNGYDATRISFQTRHRSLDRLKGYIRRATLFEHNAGALLGRKA